jgi:hypothetical protein
VGTWGMTGDPHPPTPQSNKKLCMKMQHNTTPFEILSKKYDNPQWFWLKFDLPPLLGFQQNCIYPPSCSNINIKKFNFYNV